MLFRSPPSLVFQKDDPDIIDKVMKGIVDLYNDDGGKEIKKEIVIRLEEAKNAKELDGCFIRRKPLDNFESEERLECERCLHTNPTWFKFCWQCGYRLPFNLFLCKEEIIGGCK